MSHYLVLDAAGIELRRGRCPTAMVPLQANAEKGELAISYTPSDDDPETFQLGADNILVPYLAPVSPDRERLDRWASTKATLHAALAEGYPSSVGAVDLRPDAKAVMTMAVAAGQGLDLILLDNSIVSLTAEELRELLRSALAWEQALVRDAQARKAEIFTPSNPSGASNAASENG